MATWIFKTPIVREGPSGGGSRLFYFYKLDVGVSIVKQNGVYSQQRYILDSDLPTFQELYQGGRNYEVSDETKAALIAGGVGVTEANFTEVQGQMGLHQRQTHPEYVEGCFGCKIQLLELSTGDAKRDISDKKWVGELNAYKEARAQGIQPAGTTHKHIQQAYTASEVLNKPYNADIMPTAKNITKQSVEVMKEIGQI